jgi:hypothetical protein
MNHEHDDGQGRPAGEDARTTHDRELALREEARDLERLRRDIEATQAHVNQEQSRVASESLVVSVDRAALDERAKELDRRAAALTMAERDLARRLTHAGDDPAGDASRATIEVFEEYEALWRLERRASAELTAMCDTLGKEAVRHDAARQAAEEELHALRGAIQSLHAASGEASPSSKERVRRRLGQVRALLTRHREAMRLREQDLRVKTAALDAKARRGRRTMAMGAILTRVSVFVTAMAATLSIVGVLSWLAADLIAPATYAATSTIEGQAAGRTMTVGERAAWQSLHEGLLGDPRFHDALAARFARQGYADLKSPGAVANLVTTRLTHESGATGELTLRLQGEGVDWTVHALRIITNGIVEYVNSGTIQRADGGTTAISVRPASDGRPVNSQRTLYTLIMSAAGSFACLVLGLYSWQRMAAAQARFLNSTLPIEQEAMDQVDLAIASGDLRLETHRTRRGRTPARDGDDGKAAA